MEIQNEMFTVGGRAFKMYKGSEIRNGMSDSRMNLSPCTSNIDIEHAGGLSCSELKRY